MQPQAAAARPLVMADVAARAGVSHQTVSRVVNGHHSVAPETRERVERDDFRLRSTPVGHPERDRPDRDDERRQLRDVPPPHP